MSFVNRILRKFSRTRDKVARITPYPRKRFIPTNAYLGNDTVISQLWYGDAILLDASDLHISPSVLMLGIWEPHITQFMIDNLHEGDVFLDVGANVGYFSLLASRIVQAQGLVLAFEPQARLARLVRASLEMNAYKPISFVQAIAIGEREEVGTLGHMANSSGSSSLEPGFGDGSRPADQVTVARLDTAIAEAQGTIGRSITPSMIKIDVEGYEYSVWRGMQQTIASLEKLTVLIEFSPGRYVSLGQDPSAFIADIRSHGFSIFALDNHGAETPFCVSSIPAIIARNDFIDLVLRKG